MPPFCYQKRALHMIREFVEETKSEGFDNLDAGLARIGYTPRRWPT